jgi:hypothetical protein
MSTHGELPFDTCIIAGRRHSPEEFLRLPLRSRVRHILNGEVVFEHKGQRVDAQVALNGLRASNTRE